MRYLGLDLGSKTLGIATSDLTETIATSLTTIRFEEEEYETLIDSLKTIIENEECDKIVLGFPKNMDNSIGVRAETTLMFKEKLEKELQIEVILEDERLTSVISNQVLIQADISRKKRKKKVDSIEGSRLITQQEVDKLNNIKDIIQSVDGNNFVLDNSG